MREIKQLVTADLNASTEDRSNKNEGKVFYYKTGIRRRGIELLERFCMLFPMKVPSGIRLIIAEYLWPLVLSDWSPHVFFGTKLAFAVCFLGQLFFISYFNILHNHP